MEKLKISIQIILSIFLTNSIIFLALIGVHEIAHLIIGMQIGCVSGKAVILDTKENGPYAELLCPEKTDSKLAHIGSILASIVFGSLFLLLREQTKKSLFLIFLGLSLIFSALDIVAITNVESFFYLFIILGMLILSLGECSLTFEYINKGKLFI